MYRKNFFISFLAMAMLLLSAVAVSAQMGMMRGHVVKKAADGKMERVADAQIDVYRQDLPGKYNTKTNKKGEFVFAGLPFVGTYTIFVSAAESAPTYLPNTKAGRDEDYEIVLSSGDGKRMTEEEAKKILASVAKAGSSAGAATGGGESAEDKAKREELIRKNAEIEAKNKKILESNEVIGRTFKAGNEALKLKNYDEAIKQYDLGLAADAEQPALLTNKSVALRARAVVRYNAAITSADDAAKTSGIEAAKQDFRAAADAATKATQLLKAQPAPTDPAEQQRLTANKYAAYSARAEAMRLFVTKVDATQAEAGLEAFRDYISVETDAANKSKAQLDAAQMLLDAGSADMAFTEFQKVLAQSPDDPDANLGAGLALFSTGDKAKYQQAANFLQRFVDTAPETHKFKADAKAILTELKNTEKVVPQKTTPGRRRG
ncbi:MAG TPA: carboxypeptidase regulatory-like domain-containing protein [Pyrinomonadaceae bacterium]|jgi:tetratricopeptide (TPR) repeat protein